jgi:ATP-dependent exoDNAse (exonuclease V) alpha subunit
MAIYHLSATIISRGRGQSVVAAAAYRCGAALRDERYGLAHNYRGKRGVVHTEVLAPSGAPEWAQDREQLWNRVEAREIRRDAQLARLIEVGLPLELTPDERVDLMRDFILREFVAIGMIADFCIRGEANNPHAHILLTLRGITPQGFGPKQRAWNGKPLLLEWRRAWAERANEHLARAGHGDRIDHRTLEAQEIELIAARRIGVARARRNEPNLPAHLRDRISDQRRIAHENGRMILEDPTVALRALTHQKPIFSHHELKRFLRSRTGSAEQFELVLQAVAKSADLVALDPHPQGDGRFTSRDMIEAQSSLMRRAQAMSARRAHEVEFEQCAALLESSPPLRPLRGALEHLLGAGDLKALALTGPDKSVLLRAARELWVGVGFEVTDARPNSAQPELKRNSVLVIDECQSLRLKELERHVAAADRARALAVLLGDADKLRAMKEAPHFQALLQCTPGAWIPTAISR